jgi:hypothetical protein
MLKEISNEASPNYMNIKILIAIVLILGIASGIFFWQLGRTSDVVGEVGRAPAVPADSMTREPGADDPISGRGAMATLLALGRNLECTITYEGENSAPGSASKTEGTIFMSGGALRGDFMVEAEAAAEPIVSSMILKDDTMFLWSVIDGESWGMKSSMTSVAGTSTAQLDTQEPVRINDDVAYNCKPWVGVDRSVFVPPSDVLFRDMSTIMEGGMEYGTTFEAGAVPGGGDPCAACALIDDAAAGAACREQFSCKPELR